MAHPINKVREYIKSMKSEIVDAFQTGNAKKQVSMNTKARRQLDTTTNDRVGGENGMASQLPIPGLLSVKISPPHNILENISSFLFVRVIR